MITNQYGLDYDYFERKIAVLNRDGLRNWTPDELARELARMSRTADKSVMHEPEFAASVVDLKPVGQREQFQKWVLAIDHPVLGFLDGHWLERGDDREGYANEYVQGLWVAFKQFASPPAPVAVPTTAQFQEAFRATGYVTNDQAWDLAEAAEDCLDKVKELNQ